MIIANILAEAVAAAVDEAGSVVIVVAVEASPPAVDVVALAVDEAAATVEVEEVDAVLLAVAVVPPVVELVEAVEVPAAERMFALISLYIHV